MLCSNQFSSVTQSCPTFCNPMDWSTQDSLSIINCQSLLKLISIKLVMPSNHLILCHPLSSCLQSFPASGSFHVNQFFTSSGQSIRASVSASVPPINIQDLFPLGWTDWISLQSKGPSRAKASILQHSALFIVYSHIHTWLLENHSFD